MSSVSVDRGSRAAHAAGRSRLSVWLLLLLVTVSLPTVTTRIYASDEIQYFAFLRSLWFDHDVSFDNEYRHFYDAGVARSDGFRETFLDARTVTGLRTNFGTIGCAILWAPFYGLADAGVHLARLAGSTVPADGYSAPYVAAVCYGSAAYGFLALFLSLAAARRIVPGFDEAGRWRHAAPAIVALLGTPLLFYMYVAPAFAHACSAFAVALFVVCWLRVREKWSAGGLIVLGLIAALMTMVREQDAFYALGPALDFAWSLADRLRGGRSNDGRTLRRVPGTGRSAIRMVLAGLCGCAAFALAFLPQAAAYLALNGRLGPSPLVSRKMTWTAPHALQVVLSPAHGLFVWTPLAVLALAGLAVLALRPAAEGLPAAADARGESGRHGSGAGETRRLAIALLVMAAVSVYIAGSVESWMVAGAFGQRRFVGLTVVLTVGLAVLVCRARNRPARLLLAAVLALGVWWNLGLMIQFGTGTMDRQRLEPARNAYASFVVVPLRAPSIVYRYLFDRSSFYHPAPAK